MALDITHRLGQRRGEMLDRATIWTVRRLGPERAALLAQIVRYGLTGLGVTLVQSALYAGGVYLAGLSPLASHFAASAVAVMLGYVVHSRFSFRDHGGQRGMAAFLRFVAVSLFGIALNSLWVWLLTGPLALPDWTPILAYLFVTPALVFALNRLWVFR